MKQKKLVVKMEKEEILKKLKALSYLIKNLKKVDLEILKIFVKDYYNTEFLSLEFYELLKNKLNKTRAKRTLKIMIKSDIYGLISYLKYNNEPTVNLKEFLTPEQYLSISKHSINKIIIELKKLPDEENKLFQNTKDELLWKLKRIPKKTNYEYLELAYKIYQVIGLENAMEFLSGKYGNITYEQVHFMFKNIDIIKLPNKMAQQSLINFLFSNKKSYNNIIRQMLEGNFNELFLNFDYFYNNIEFFINKLGTRLSKSKVKDLINDRFISHDVSTPEITNDLLDDIEQVLEEEAKELNIALENILDKQKQWQEKRIINSKIARNRHLLLDLQKKLRNKDICINNSKTVSVLLASWKQIGELLQTLSYAFYIDDQLEITEIENICQALIKRGKFEEEPWELRKTILKDIVTHEFYDYYSCYDSMKDLSENLYITEDEIIAYADMLNATDTYAREAADLYRKHGKIEKYVQYLETHLDKSSKEYVELIEYYHNIGNDENARHIAQQGLNNCRDDLTELFIFLLHDAKKYGEIETYKKLYASAKRRKKANIIQIDNSLNSIT